MKDVDEKRSKARERLSRCRVRPSAQRVAIMQYLLTHCSHPTIDEIYNALCPIIPTLSKTTVYNTLRMFYEVGAAQQITIDDHHVCYDGEIRPHAHFVCRNCGRLKDIWDKEIIPPKAIKQLKDGSIIDEVQIYCKGYCDECQKQLS